MPGSQARPLKFFRLPTFRPRGLCSKKKKGPQRATQEGLCAIAISLKFVHRHTLI